MVVGSVAGFQRGGLGAMDLRWSGMVIRVHTSNQNHDLSRVTKRASASQDLSDDYRAVLGCVQANPSIRIGNSQDMTTVSGPGNSISIISLH